MTYFLGQSWPSPEEKRTIEAEIRALESEMGEALALLQNTQRRIDDLTKRLYETKLRIAPIKMVTFDILSMIFEFCARNDWRSPLLVGSICRDWRATVLQTPRAWQFINTAYCSKELVCIYSERSQQRGLHINVPGLRHKECIKSISHQVYCMKLSASASEVLENDFTSLLGLRIAYRRGLSIDASLLSASRFPSLRDLRMYTIPLSKKALSSFPPLERLSVMIDANEIGLDIINACAASLKSLDMNIVDDNFASTSLTLKLPRLSNFQISHDPPLKAAQEAHPYCSRFIYICRRP